MTDPLSTLRELVTNWKADVLKYGCTIHLGVDELEALLPALEQRERDKVAAAYEDAVALTIAMAEGVRDGKLLPSCANPMLVFLGLTELGRAFHERARAALGPELSNISLCCCGARIEYLNQLYCSDLERQLAALNPPKEQEAANP